MADAADVAVRFSEALEFLRRQLAIGADEWLRILAEEGATSSAIADDVVRSLTQDLAKAVLQRMEEGGTLDDFRRDYHQAVEERGWSYKGNEGWHSRLIWRLHTGNAFAAGRWEQAQRLEAANPGTIFARLVTAGDHRVRPTHEEMDGIIRPIGDAYWTTHWPPNGFNCRCHAQILTRRQLDRHKLNVTRDSDPRLTIPPDPGWEVNMGMLGSRLSEIA